ncbi:two-component system regulatory protein YycI [Gracilibacillus suaedae]|uniref:two-component system regulatory protein YycI n=1 Tax=Gracilibacillus suaedae TaxID=2820273 RepID=UPI001ABE15F5|nr:two-component system regulatory protein YycI [Gracilibacillus suaedae]
MQWGQIKTLFILCFLILDIFLLHHFITYSTTNYEPTDNVPMEDNVRNNVNGLSNVPEESPSEEAMLSAERKEFTETEESEIANLPNQGSIIIDHHLIISEFDQPLAINVEEDTEALAENIWNFDQYQYFGKNEAANTYIFFQVIDRPIYFNSSGTLLIQVNEEGEVTHYVQTILEKTDDQTEPEEINSPMNALTGLYLSDGFIHSGDEITAEVQLGYHNLLPLANGAQLLAPTWQFEVNEESHYYVNAIEGHSTSSDSETFIREMKTQIMDYFAEDSTADIEITDEEWEEEDIELLLAQLLEIKVETNGVE